MLDLTSNVPLNKNCFLLDHPYLKLSVETCYPVLSNGKQDQKRIYSPPRITSKTDTTQVYPPRLFVSEIQSGAGWGLTGSTVGSIGHKIPWFPKAVFFSCSMVPFSITIWILEQRQVWARHAWKAVFLYRFYGHPLKQINRGKKEL